MSRSVTPSKGIKILAFSLFCGFVFFYLEDSAILQESEILFRNFGSLLKALVYLSAFGLGILAISFMLLAKQKWVRWMTLPFVALFIFGDQVYLGISGKGFGYHELGLLYYKSGFGLEKNVLSSYAGSLGKALLVSLSFAFLTISFWIYDQGRSMVGARFYLPTLVLALSLTYSIVHFSNANRNAFPSPVRGLSLIAYMVTNPLFAGDRMAVKGMNLESGMDIDHIVWIIDESIRADHLQINDSTLVTTPFLASIPEKLINLGISVSGAVCSDYSDFMLYTGLRPDQVPDTENVGRKQPTIFQYAEAAGYTTCHNSAVQHSDRPQHLMTESDYSGIDIHHSIPMLHSDAEHYDFDFVAVDYLKQDIAEHAKTFTYLMKYGAHFHYEQAYPMSHQFLQPTQQPSEFGQADREALINSYHNSIRWTVDHFFEVLDASFNDEKVLVIYTSDHGQNIMDDPTTDLFHCAKGPAPKQMANVPLVLYSPNQVLLNSIIQRIPSQNANHTSHQDIFGTTLSILGYDHKHSSLFDDRSSYVRQYTSGDIFGRGSFAINAFDE